MTTVHLQVTVESAHMLSESYKAQGIALKEPTHKEKEIC